LGPLEIITLQQCFEAVLDQKNKKKLFEFYRRHQGAKNFSDAEVFHQAVSREIGGVDWPQFQKAREKAQEILETSASQSVSFIRHGDREYPPQFYDLPNPPMLLYVKGNSDLLTTSPRIGVIGSREPSELGKRYTREVACALVAENAIVVSGFALGVDAKAHKASLEAGRTIAVMARPVFDVAPGFSHNLGAQMLTGARTGKVCFVSELPPGTSYDKDYFRRQSELTATLSKAVVVVQGNVRSGTVMTANIFLDKKKPVACLNAPEEVTGFAGNKQLLAKPGVKGVDPAAIPNQVKAFVASLGASPAPQASLHSWLKTGSSVKRGLGYDGAGSDAEGGGKKPREGEGGPSVLPR
jgi:DNA processing protein